MITIEFGKAENQTLDSNSLFIKLYGNDFRENLDKIKNFWNRKYLKDTLEWEIPFSCWEEIKQLFSGVHIKYLNEPPKAKLVSDSDIVEGMDFNGYNLYDYQLEGVRYGLNHHNFLLLDEQGCGKSLQLITLARYRKLHQGLKHCLIICGVNSLKYNWQREVHKFCKEEEAIVLGTKINSKGRVVPISKEETKKQIESCPKEFFWIINIEKMQLTSAEKKSHNSIIDYFNKHIETGNLGLIAIDEIHKIKNIRSQCAQGVLSLNPKASKVGMTGTLLVNNPLDLYCPMSFIGLINYSKWAFDNKYVVKDDWNRPIGFQNMDDLHDILYRSSLRRTKDLLDLPEKIYKQEFIEGSDDEWKVLNDIMGYEYNGKYLDKIDPILEPIVMVTRMRQATVAPELITSQKIPSSKFTRLCDILEEAKMNGQKVLVFCPFTEALELGMEYCKEYQPKLIKGGMGDKLEQVKYEHENTAGFSVLFAQESTLGVGHTLTNTNIVVFLSPPWNKATYDQCADRCFAKNTIVMTTKGPKYIQNVNESDYVYTPLGNIKRVVATHKIPTNEKLMAKVKLFGLGEEFEICCTADHKVMDSNGKWREIQDFKCGEFVHYIPEVEDDYGDDMEIDMQPYMEASYKTINSQGVVKEVSTTHLYSDKLVVDEDFMFMLGFYLGDGFVFKDLKKIGFCGNCTTKWEALERVQKYINRISNAKMNIDVPADGNLGRQLNVRCEPLARFIELNFGRVCEEKYIPKWVFSLKKNLQLSFLKGLIESDGHTIVSENLNNSIHYSYVTTTPAIATGVWFLCYRVGYKAQFRTRFLYERGAKREYFIEFTKVGVKNPRGDRDIRTGKIKSIKLYSIKNHKNTILYDISVEDDECYMVGNLPVHNCHRIGQHNTVQIIDLYMKDTYDEIINAKLHGKGAMADMLIDGDNLSKDKIIEAINNISKMGISFSKKSLENRNLF